MPSRIEDYALIGDTQTAALVARDGSVDWLCLPRFDSPACFAALLGEPIHGRWLIAPQAAPSTTRRRYLPGTLVLETELETPDGTVALIDFMPPRDRAPDVVRIVEGRSGRVPMRMELILRFDYGQTIPWVRRVEGQLVAIAGPDLVTFDTRIETHGVDFTTLAEFTVERGDRVPFVLTWHPSNEPPPDPVDAEDALKDTEAYWTEWSHRCVYGGEWKEAVNRSLITLKALTYAPTGGIVAAPTTSLPEWIGGVRNWDYRYCWLRDATFTLYALSLGGYREEAEAWRTWLLRAVAGSPSAMRIMYGPAGERLAWEMEADWLPGYEGSGPVRLGNAAVRQFQLDVFGEVMDSLSLARRQSEETVDAWAFQLALMDFLESSWDQPDAGIWEVRGPPRHFTHSKVMAWVGMDRAVKAVERTGLEGPVERWRAARERIRDEILQKGFDAERGSFVQFYGSKDLDSSLLMLPLVGFLPAEDERMRGTIEAIERELVIDGLVRRYKPDPEVDGLPDEEGAFVACSFWLVDNLELLGRREEACSLFERLLALRNDVGLLSEEYDPRAKRQLGNFPQAFSHVALINSAHNLSEGYEAPARNRQGQ